MRGFSFLLFLKMIKNFNLKLMIINLYTSHKVANGHYFRKTLEKLYKKSFL